MHEDVFQALGLAGEFDDLKARIDDLTQERGLLSRSAGVRQNHLAIAKGDVADIIAGSQVVHDSFRCFEHAQADFAASLGLVADFVDRADG